MGETFHHDDAFYQLGLRNTPGCRGWGRSHEVAVESGRFHGIKQKDKGRPIDDYGVNPDTGDVVDPSGESVGNLEDVKSK